MSMNIFKKKVSNQDTWKEPDTDIDIIDEYLVSVRKKKKEEERKKSISQSVNWTGEDGEEFSLTLYLIQVTPETWSLDFKVKRRGDTYGRCIKQLKFRNVDKALTYYKKLKKIHAK